MEKKRGFLRYVLETLSFFPAALAQEEAAATPTGGSPAVASPVREAAAAQSADEAGWRRLTGEGLSQQNERDLTPMAQDRMQKTAEWLWQANVLANRLIELPLAYLLAEGVTLQCPDPDNQKLLNAFWNDPINNWPVKLEARARALALLGELCFTIHVNEHSGFVRHGYLDSRNIAHVITDPDNPEQPIGVVTKRDAKGRQYKYRVLVLGEDSELFSARTQRIRSEDFQDGDCLLYQVNKLPSGTRGRSDLLGSMDWLDAYDEFLFGELDRTQYLRAFVWDLTVKGGTDDDVKKWEKNFKPPAPNSTFVHNESLELKPQTPQINAAETTETARLLRNHVTGGNTMPEHWFGGGGDVNRAAASEMGEPTFKVYTARQSTLKRMLEEMGRVVLWKNAKKYNKKPDWSEEEWLVTAVFPEMVSRDVTKFAAAMTSVCQAVVQMIDAGLLTEETALKLVADVAQRFGQEFDAATELAAAREEREERRKDREGRDVFNLDNLPADVRAEIERLGKAKPGQTAPTQATQD
jgi:hypothetical protein